MRTLTVNQAMGDWAARRRAVAEFLGLTSAPSAAASEFDLARHTGRGRFGSRSRPTRAAP